MNTDLDEHLGQDGRQTLTKKQRAHTPEDETSRRRTDMELNKYFGQEINNNQDDEQPS